MTRYVFKLDPIGDRSLLNDGDTFTIYPHSTNTAGSRIEVGFCSGAYPLVFPNGTALPIGFLEPGGLYEVTWVANSSWFTTPSTFTCELLAGEEILTFFDTPPTIPPNPETRTLWLVAKAPESGSETEAYFYYGDSNSAPVPPSAPSIWLHDPDMLIGGGAYEARVVLANPDTDSWPITMVGDPVDVWLPMTTDRQWGFTAQWISTDWLEIDLAVLMQFRDARRPVSCISEFRTTLVSGSEIVGGPP